MKTAVGDKGGPTTKTANESFFLATNTTRQTDLFGNGFLKNSECGCPLRAAEHTSSTRQLLCRTSLDIVPWSSLCVDCQCCNAPKKRSGWSVAHTTRSACQSEATRSTQTQCFVDTHGRTKTHTRTSPNAKILPIMSSKALPCMTHKRTSVQTSKRGGGGGWWRWWRGGRAGGG